MALCTRQVSDSEIVRRIGVSRAVLYKWKDEIIGNSAYQTIRKHNEPSLECSGAQNQDTGITCFHFSSCNQGDKPPLFV